MPLQIRRGTNAERQAMAQPLAPGELLYVTDDQRLYIGNGSTLGGVQITGYNDDDARDAASTILTSGTHSGIGFTYNTATNLITATVDLSNYTGTIKASSFKGTIVADDSTMLIDAIDGKINLDGTVKGNIIPDANEAYDIGSSSFRFRDLYLSGSSIELGSATITAVGSVVNLPAGSTIGGEPLNATNLLTELSANIIADDSTVIVNTTTKTITGSLVGNLFTNLIDSADSSEIVVTPNTRFEADLIVENDIIPAKIVMGGVEHTTIGRELFPTPQTGETNLHYLSFTDGVSGRTIVKSDGNLRYTPSTGTIETTNLISTNAVNSPNINSTVVRTGEIIANNVLEITSLLNVGTTRHIVSIGSNTVDGRLRIMSNSFKNLSQVVVDQYHSSVDADGFRFIRGRGTSVSPSIVQSGDEIADINFAAWDGATNRFAANIIVTVADTPSSGVMPSEINFRTTNSTGITNSAIRLTKDQTTEFGGAAILKSYADSTARDLAIPVPVAGMMVYISGTGKFQGYNGSTSTWNDLN